MMSNKFNADTLKSMNSIPPAIKHLFVIFMIGFFFCSVIQTTTYFEIIAEASYEISDNNPSENFTKRAHFLVTMGINPTESNGGGEKHGQKLPGTNRIPLRKWMKIGHKFAVRDSQKFGTSMGEHNDEWQRTLGRCLRKFARLGKKRLLNNNPKCYNNYEDDEERTSVKHREIKDLNDWFGGSETEFRPNIRQAH